MKTLEEIKDQLVEEKKNLRDRYDVNLLGIFGSYVRGEEREESDLDILIDYEEPPSLITLVEIEYHLTDIVGIKVDLVTSKGIKPQLKSSIVNELVYL